jgi:catechol 2,3-dioxygenase-like lactoylglutathione lyase family enzyme
MYQIQFLKFGGYTHGKVRTDEVSIPEKSAMFIDMLLHGLGCRTAILAVSLTTLFSSGSLASEPLGHAAQTPSILGRGMGVNHVSILVHDLSATLGLFRDQLGFNANSWGRFAEGLENGGIEFSNHTYLEFLAVYDPQKAASSDEAAFLKDHEGAIGVGLETDSAERAAALLRSQGIGAKVATTTSEGYAEPGVKFSGAWLFREIDLPKGTPGGPFLIEYNRANQPERAKDPEIARKRALERIHPNGAIRVSAVWIAVKDLNTSIEIYKRLGLTPGRAIEVPELSAKGREIVAGSGVLLLLAPQPNRNSGPVVDFLASRGEGLMGVTIEVADIERARDYLETHSGGVLDPRWKTDGYVLIPAAAAHGFWLRFVRARQQQAGRQQAAAANR